MAARRQLGRVRRLVIKVGTSLITEPGTGPAPDRIAALATELAAARHLLYDAAARFAAGAECAAAASMAKLFCTEVANRVAYQAVQMHGGYGYMRESPVEGFFRDVRLWTIASGTSEMMREIIARRLFA